MLHQHYTEYLKKEIDFIKILVSRFHEQEQLMDIELDLVLTKVQVLYEQLLKLKLIHAQSVSMYREQPEEKKPASTTEERLSAIAETLRAPIKRQEQTVDRKETPKVADAVNPPKNSETGTLVDKIRPEGYSHINESLASPKTDLAGKLQTAPLRRITEGIGVNDRFLFVRELFGGNSDLYNETVKILDADQTLADALKFIEQQFDWDKKAESTRKFIQLLHRRHG